MKQLLLLWVLLSTLGAAQAAPTPTADSAAYFQARRDSLQGALRYQTGTIKLPDDVGEITVPKGFRYLDATQSQQVLTQFWGNPDGKSLGMIFPADKGPLDEKGWAFIVEYEQVGYVKDDDADKINYDELLTEMKADVEEGNQERIDAGYDPITLIGWAAKPYYDKEKKALHWAKVAQFGTATEHVMNYNLRLLGRKGVLVLNAVGSPGQLAEVRQSIPGLIAGVSFSKGLQYADFNPSMDEVAAYTIGGLVAGKVLAKAGLIGLGLKFGKVILLTLLKFWKVALALLAGAWTFIRRFFGKTTPEEAAETAEPQLALEAEAPGKTDEEV
ncbi:DUF2167 domain-containing protein [Hymenobacter sp. BT635]|uniref:DUF2167 domain-containing protein n=1 Tax=Hymenobacter nitidus TaxID=2880929 RepID=A0ABS8A9R0_9BACT|nr:DUF2167 domain-containing protein [Hymenobacter nitidus]MCB2375950.1 DUF2167 domain-containing protein [Hymenobacter nitidus]